MDDQECSSLIASSSYFHTNVHSASPELPEHEPQDVDVDALHKDLIASRKGKVVVLRHGFAAEANRYMLEQLHSIMTPEEKEILMSLNVKDEESSSTTNSNIQNPGDQSIMTSIKRSESPTVNEDGRNQFSYSSHKRRYDHLSEAISETEDQDHMKEDDDYERINSPATYHDQDQHQHSEGDLDMDDDVISLSAGSLSPDPYGHVPPPTASSSRMASPKQSHSKSLPHPSSSQHLLLCQIMFVESMLLKTLDMTCTKLQGLQPREAKRKDGTIVPFEDATHGERSQAFSRMYLKMGKEAAQVWKNERVTVKADLNKLVQFVDVFSKLKVHVAGGNEELFNDGVGGKEMTPEAVYNEAIDEVRSLCRKRGVVEESHPVNLQEALGSMETIRGSFTTVQNKLASIKHKFVINWKPPSQSSTTNQQSNQTHTLPPRPTTITLDQYTEAKGLPKKQARALYFKEKKLQEEAGLVAKVISMLPLAIAAYTSNSGTGTEPAGSSTSNNKRKRRRSIGDGNSGNTDTTRVQAQAPGQTLPPQKRRKPNKLNIDVVNTNNNNNTNTHQNSSQLVSPITPTNSTNNHNNSNNNNNNNTASSSSGPAQACTFCYANSHDGDHCWKKYIVLKELSELGEIEVLKWPILRGGRERIVNRPEKDTRCFFCLGGGNDRDRGGKGGGGHSERDCRKKNGMLIVLEALGEIRRR
ncbi:hypothetical protein HDU76_004355 [Blyttiomyces sp. JEL0837]|nr:hypothetical protein HDU76_004355 [Blyttiomyces sp. JEL0837]